MVFRLVDTKVGEMNAEQAVESLKEERPDLYGKDVYATRLYLLTGEIEARDCLEEWFDGATDFKISKGASRSINQADIDESSPILLGNTRTNQYMREILKEDGNICIFKYTPSSSAWWRSETQLQKRSRACEPVVQKAPSSLVKLSYCVISHNMVSSRLSQRFANPSEEGAVTMICSDYAHSLGHVARTLTDDKATWNAGGDGQRPLYFYPRMIPAIASAWRSSSTVE